MTMVSRSHHRLAGLYESTVKERHNYHHKQTTVRAAAHVNMNTFIHVTYNTSK